MGERKVLNMYYPLDFDPAKIPRRRQPNNQQMKIRMMLPMSIRCGTCGNYIYKGTKFNSRKEDVVGETYLGIQIFRFYFKCTKCSAEMTFKTDPQNSDYIVESGASRNFEPWQMDILAALEELKSMKSRHATVSVDSMLEALQRSNEQKERKLLEEEEAYIKAVFQGQKKAPFVRRIDDDSDEDLEFFSFDGKAGVDGASDGGKPVSKTSSIKFSIIKKSVPQSSTIGPEKGQQDVEPAAATNNVLQSLFQQYGSDED
ncbi:hypothetical protein SASPL_133412 [Salvia splendens]|uniref:Splicing factor YJU2 n=1 Tax=Salvia splendens TaxID=180675 RepID=A0A8X8X2Z9_SALSN|nr:hypothetical protein SASPL_133412 [Salvia splendens]